MKSLVIMSHFCGLHWGSAFSARTSALQVAVIGNDIIEFMSIENSLGVINHKHPSTRRTDYLYRISLKCLVRNEKGEVLVVKETGRDWWDLPGGGMDHGEDIKVTIAREMNEEVSLEGDFDYRIIDADEPAHLGTHNFWQLRLIYEVTPRNMTFTAGEDGDEVAFKNPNTFKDSESEVERRIYKYNLVAGEK